MLFRSATSTTGAWRPSSFRDPASGLVEHGVTGRDASPLAVHLHLSRAFEQEVRGFIAENLTAEVKHAQSLTPSVFSDPDIGIAWQKALHHKGWGAPGWPVEYGGTGWSEMQRYIFASECMTAHTPILANFGTRMCGPVLMKFGKWDHPACCSDSSG